MTKDSDKILKTILRVVNSQMCSGCGLCDPLCPFDAISMHLTAQGVWEPEVDFDSCTLCEYCLKVCGRYEFDYEKVRKAAFGDAEFHNLIGHHLQCYRGHSSDQGLRLRSSSGGAVTTLLQLAFDLDLIDCAIVTGMTPDNPLGTAPRVVYDRDELVHYAEARYAPSPVDSCLREITNDRRVAIVGLPCHFESLRKAELKQSRLRKRIILRLGLFCSHNVSTLATEFVIRHLGVKRADVVRFRYRGDGWPSGIRVSLANGEEHFLPNQGSLWTQMFMSFMFAAPYCLLCSDHTSELADISFGDAWLPEIMESETFGESIIIARTLIGEKLLEEAMRQGVLDCVPLALSRVLESQKWPLYFKKRLIYLKRQLHPDKRFDLHRSPSPEITIEMPPFSKTERWLASRAWFNASITRHAVMPTILSLIPERFLRRYTGNYSNALWQAAVDWFEGGER